jgi:hypothetical protein
MRGTYGEPDGFGSGAEIKCKEGKYRASRKGVREPREEPDGAECGEWREEFCHKINIFQIYPTLADPRITGIMFHLKRCKPMNAMMEVASAYQSNPPVSGTKV